MFPFLCINYTFFGKKQKTKNEKENWIIHLFTSRLDLKRRKFLEGGVGNP